MSKIKIIKKISAFPLQSNTGFNILTTRPEYEETSGTGSNGYDRNVSTIRSYWKDSIADRVTSYPTSTSDYVSYNSLNIPLLSQSYNIEQKSMFFDETGLTYRFCFDNFQILTSSYEFGQIKKSFWPLDNYLPTLYSSESNYTTGSVTCPLNPLSSSNLTSNIQKHYYYSSSYYPDTPYGYTIKGDLSSHHISEILSFISAKSGSYITSSESYTDGNTYSAFWTKKVERFQYSTSSLIPIPRASYTYTNFFSSRRNELSNGPFLNNGVVYVTDKLSGKKPFYDSYSNFSSEFYPIIKNYSLIPEYISEETIDNIIINGNYTSTYNYLTTYGKNDSFIDFNTPYVSSSYNTSEILTDVSYNDYNFSLNKIKIDCESIIKFLPYNGFYPQTRATKVINNFQESYFNYSSSNILLDSNVTSNIYSSSSTPYATGSTFNHQIQTVLQQFFAPGVLFNSIKSGMGVTYPAFITSSVPFSSSTPPEFYGMFIYDAVPAASSSFSSYTINKNYNKFFNIQDLLDVDNSMNSFYSGNNSLYYLAPTAYEEYYHRGNPVYPQYSMTPDFKNINQNTLTAKDDRYKFSIHNYLSEIVNTFINNSSLTTFVSVPEGDFGTFLSGTIYSMGIRIEKQNKNLKMFVNYTADSSPSYINVTPASLYGPPSRFFETSSGGILSSQAYLADISFAPYLPPYYFGSSEIRLSFTPTETREYSAKEIIESLVISTDYTKDIINAFTTISPAVSNYQDTVAYQNIQDLKKCINISLTKEREKNLNSETGETTSNASEDRISIQTLFESPILNFNNSSNISASYKYVESSEIRTDGGASFVGMWSGYGEIPNDSELVTISLLDKYESGSLSLLNKCFSKTNIKKPIGKLKDTAEFSEAIVLIPYTHIDSNEYATVSRVDLENGIDQTNEQSEYVVPYYYNLDINVINKLLNIDDKQARLFLNRKNVDLEYLRKLDERLQTLNKNNSIVSCMSNMQKYVLPPHLDWIRNTQVNPFAMYFIEFSQKLTKQDLADIWQGLLPSSGTSFKVVNSSIEHELGDLEFYHGKKLQPDIRFKIFKVKKRAKTNYYELTSDLEDDRKYKGRFGTQEEVVPLYSYNWPHDHYSLIQGSKVTVELQLSKEQE